MNFYLAETGYILDEATNVWSRQSYAGIAYSDGDEVEQRIASIIDKSTDLSVLSTELRQHCTDWPSLYHLSGTRANILRPFENELRGDILEIGAGCGAITRYLGECGGNILALEGSPRRAAIARARTHDLQNVTVVSDRFDLFSTDQKFDAITLIGVLEYANLFTPGENPALNMLERVRALLKPEGKLFIAIENQLGLKYFAGAPEDHIGQPMYGIEGRYRTDQPQTFGRKVLASLLKQAGFSSSEFLAPFPDYKLPVSIITEHGFSSNGFDAPALAYQSVRRDPQLPSILMFSPELVWPIISNNGLALDLANSFLIVTSPEQSKNLVPSSILAWHFTVERQKRFCKITKFIQQQANQIAVRYTRLDRNVTNPVISNLLTHNLSDQAEYKCGGVLSYELIHIVTREGWCIEEVCVFLRKWLNFISNLAATQNHAIDLDLSDPSSLLPRSFFDLIPQNIIVSNDSSFYVIDTEWIANEKPEVGYIVFRALLLLIHTVTKFGRPVGDIGTTYQDFILSILNGLGWSIDDEFIDRYITLETKIQAEVSGCFVDSRTVIDRMKEAILPTANLNQVVAERDNKIINLNQAIVTRDNQIINLNQAMAARDKHIRYQEYQTQILLQSRSWRWTKPLRLISSQLSLDFGSLWTMFKRNVERLPFIRRHAIRRIKLSPLFDQQFYAERNQDVKAAGVDLAAHYFFSGWKEHRDPSAEFSTRHYLEIHPDVAIAGINPLLHYIKYGQAENRKINHAVGLSEERAIDYDAIAIEVDVIKKSGLFDANYYIAMYPDIQPSPMDSIHHYCERGWREGRNPSENFDTRSYLETYSDIKDAGINPFWHYVTAGRSESRQATTNSTNRYEDDIYFGKLPSDIRLIAYYANPDWSAVLHARNTIKGASQVLMPHGDLGFYSVSEPGTFAKQALIARRHGVSSWCFALNTAQNSASVNPLREFLSNRDIQIKFILDINLHSSQIDAQQVAFLESALVDERYLRIDGRPVVVMTLPDEERLCDAALTAFAALFNRAPTLYRIARRDGLIEQTVEAAIRLKLEAVLDFPISPIPGETGSFSPLRESDIDSVPYSIVVSQAINRIMINNDQIVPCYRAVTLGRDDSPLKPNKPLRYVRYHLKEYRRWLDAAMADTRTKHTGEHRLLFINAWNNWNQGAALEPDLFSGYGKLNETSRALLGLPLGLTLPKVSVIVPNYNHAAYLRRRLDSIYHQTYTNIEVLLLDDCSTDHSCEILTEYANWYPKITTVLFNQENSGGVFRQWAKGIKAATGDLIWIAESDDYCDKDFLEKLIRCFDDEAVMLAYSKIEFVRSDESMMPDEFWHHIRDLDCREKWKHSYVNTAHQEVSEALGIINTIPNASGAIFRRPVDMPLLEDEAWLSMRVVGDWIFYLHQLRGGKIAYLVETTNYFRRYAGSTAASTYKQEIFYRELSIAARTVQSLYDTPYAVIEKFDSKIKEYYHFHGDRNNDKFRSWYNEKDILEARRFRTPNIAVSTMGFYPGGAEILPIRMANEFKRQGHSVILLSAGHGSREDGVRQMLRKDIPVIETTDIELTKQLIHDFGIEVLNSHQWHIQKYPVYVPDVFRELKAHVASLHGMIEYGDVSGVTSEQLQIADENVTTWVYTADKNLKPFIDHELYKGNSPRFIKLPNGMKPPMIKPVARSEIGIPDDAFVLCCVSRAIPDKGWAETIEAVDKAREITGKDIRLILVGNGLVYDEYCHSGVPSFVYLAGFSENSVGFYAAADMGIMLTKFKSESFPLTIVDCLFADKPYIATAVGEIRNMLTTDHGLAGKVIELENWEIPIDQAAQVIATYATDTDVLRLSKEMVAEAANRYRIDAVVKQYVSIFEYTIQARHSNVPTTH